MKNYPRLKSWKEHITTSQTQWHRLVLLVVLDVEKFAQKVGPLLEVEDIVKFEEIRDHKWQVVIEVNLVGDDLEDVDELDHDFDR